MNINKKRKKSSRDRGKKTAGTGAMKKGRGKGHRGGIGMAGTGKRADHKKSLITNLDYKYFGKSSMKAKPKNYDVLNIDDVAIRGEGKTELDLSKYKVLGRGEIKTALTIKAHKISKTAREKIEKAGGKVILAEKKVKIDKKKEEIKNKKE
ncbi:MAG: uL15 family ribosomal protein [Nanoarchaeota archaeon]|nr:uL15 family ribosomal protein [Nanoarchaeota archaeon]